MRPTKWFWLRETVLPGACDLGEKLEHHRTIPSLKDLLFLAGAGLR